MWLLIDAFLFQDERQRKYNSNYEIKAPTEAQIEAFNITRIHSSDPMAKYMNDKWFITFCDFVIRFSLFYRLRETN